MDCPLESETQAVSRNRSDWLLLAAAVSIASSASADVRISSFRFDNICQVVITVDNPHRRKVVFNGRFTRGKTVTVRGSNQTVCVQRSYNPHDCRSGLTRPGCKYDRGQNRTVVFNIN